MVPLSASSPSARRWRSQPSAPCAGRHRGKTPTRCRRTSTHGLKRTRSNTASSARKQTPRRNPGRPKPSRHRIPNPTSRMPRSARPARSRSSRATSSWCGATARGYSIYAATWPWRSAWVMARSSCGTSRARAATDTTARTMSRSTQRCSLVRRAGARCRCSGCATTNSPGRRADRRWRSRSAPRSPRTAA